MIDKNYKLTNNNYINFHSTEDGIDYTFYNLDGTEIDGGILETNKMNEEEIVKQLSKFTNVNFENRIEINNNDFDEIINKIQI